MKLVFITRMYRDARSAEHKLYHTGVIFKFKPKIVCLRRLGVAAARPWRWLMLWSLETSEATSPITHHRIPEESIFKINKPSTLTCVSVCVCVRAGRAPRRPLRLERFRAFVQFSVSHAGSTWCSRAVTHLVVLTTPEVYELRWYGRKRCCQTWHGRWLNLNFVLKELEEQRFKFLELQW